MKLRLAGIRKKSQINLKRIFPILFIFALFLLEYHYFFGIRIQDWRLAVFHYSDATYCWLGFVDMVLHNQFFSSNNHFINIYGFFFFHISYFILCFRELIMGSLSFLDFYIAMRWTCFLFSLASLILYFPLSKTYKLPSWFPYFAIFATLTFQPFLLFSFEPKPDTLQYFFIILTMIFIHRCRNSDGAKNLLLASLFSGLAAAAKLGGFFLIPIIFAANIFGILERKKAKNINCKMLSIAIKRLFMITTTVTGVYLILNLHWIFHFRESLAAFQRADDLYWKGGGEIWTWQSWQLIWHFGWFLVCNYFIWTFLRIRSFLSPSKVRQRKPSAEEILLAFPLMFFCILSLTIHDWLADYYLLPTLPVLLIGCSRLISLVWSKIKPYASEPWISCLLGFGLFGLMVSGDANRVRPVVDFINLELHDQQTTRFQTGIYLREHYPKESRIFRSYYWWVPEYFQHDQFFMFSAPTEIDFYQPDLILLCDGSPNLYVKNIETLLYLLRSGKLPYHLAKRFQDNTDTNNFFEIYEHNDFQQRMADRKAKSES